MTGENHMGMGQKLGGLESMLMDKELSNEPEVGLGY